MASSKKASQPPRTALTPNAPEMAPTIPADIRELLGPAPITSLENAEAYERILSKMAEAVAPKDFVEWTWLKDIVDLGWEAGRARRAKAVSLALARRSGIQSILCADCDDLRYNSKRADDIIRGTDEGLHFFALTLERMGLTEQSVSDAAYLEALPYMDRLEDLIDTINARRDAILREIERRRDSVARRLREAPALSDDVIDADFENDPDQG